MYEILTDRAVLEITGDDTIKFLQNLTTNNITKTDYCYSYMLNNQGRYLFDFFVFISNENKILIDVNKHVVDALISHLSLYKLRAKVEINDLSNIYQIIYSRDTMPLESIMSKKDPRYIGLGIRHIVKKELSENQNAIGLYLTDKYNFAIIDGYEDLIYGKSIPIEYGANELNAISYDKGCYIGQEVISRAKYQGVVRKSIFKISANSDLLTLSKGDDILASDIKIGTVCSVYNNFGIALIRHEEYLSKKDLEITTNGVSITLSIPPWKL